MYDIFAIKRFNSNFRVSDETFRTIVQEIQQLYPEVDTTLFYSPSRQPTPENAKGQRGAQGWLYEDYKEIRDAKVKAGQMTKRSSSKHLNRLSESPNQAQQSMNIFVIFRKKF